MKTFVLVAWRVVGEREQREKPCQAGGGREQGEITPAGGQISEVYW